MAKLTDSKMREMLANTPGMPPTLPASSFITGYDPGEIPTGSRYLRDYLGPQLKEGLMGTPGAIMQETGIADLLESGQQVESMAQPETRPQTAGEWISRGAGVLGSAGMGVLTAADLATDALPGVGPAKAAVGELAETGLRHFLDNPSAAVIVPTLSKDKSEMLYEQVDRLPEITSTQGAKSMSGMAPKLKKQMAMYEKNFGENQVHRQLAAQYNQGNLTLEEAEKAFRDNINRGPDNNSIFDLMYDQQWGMREAKKDKTPFKEGEKMPVGRPRGAGANMKAEGEYIGLDTSRGCLGNCADCYSLTGSSGMNKCFAIPTRTELTGDFWDNPDIIRRIGENGEPNFNPDAFEKYKDALYGGLQGTAPLGRQDLDSIIDEVYDWSFTNKQLDNTNLSSAGYVDDKGRWKPGGRDQTFFITKLLSLKNFDPQKVRNLEVSVDPLNDVHFFRTMKNVEALMQLPPDIRPNIMLRVRSFASTSDEFNTLMKVAVDTANRHDLPVLETRMRYKSGETLAKTQPLPNEYFHDAQYKHVSYWPSDEPKKIEIQAEAYDTGLDKGVLKRPRGGVPGPPQRIERPVHITEIGYRTEDGKLVSGGVTVHAIRDWRKTGTTAQRRKAAVKAKEQKKWIVMVDGQPMATTPTGLPKKLSQENAIKEAKKLVKERVGGKMTGELEVFRYANEESPLSQMGLKQNLMRQCNAFNSGAGACQRCSACRAFIMEGQTRAAKKAAPEALGPQ